MNKFILSLNFLFFILANIYRNIFKSYITTKILLLCPHHLNVETVKLTKLKVFDLGKLYYTGKFPITKRLNLVKENWV